MTDESKDVNLLLISIYLLSVSKIVTMTDDRKDINLHLISICISLTQWEISFVLTIHYIQVTKTKFVGQTTIVSIVLHDTMETIVVKGA